MRYIIVTDDDLVRRTESIEKDELENMCNAGWIVIDIKKGRECCDGVWQDIEELGP